VPNAAALSCRARFENPVFAAIELDYGEADAGAPTRRACFRMQSAKRITQSGFP
jgi:hypothetical protein